MAVPYTFFYNAQIREHISQFLRIFSGLQVQYGVDRDGDGTNDFRTVNVHYADMEKVVAQVLYKDSTFQSNKLPMITGWLSQIDMNPENRKAPNHVDNIVRVRESDNTRIATSRLMSVPYRATMELYIWTSNSGQMFQLLEQIMMLFNPHLIMQTSENLLDWTNIARVELESISTEQNVPAGVDERLITQTLTFSFDFYLSFPYKEYDGIIEQIYINMKDNTHVIEGIDLDTFTVDENTPE